MKAIQLVIKSLTIFFGFLYLIYVSYVYFNQEEMIFPASRLAKDYKFKFNPDFEELNIPSFDKTNLNGLLFKVANPKGLVFYLHGNGDSVDSWGHIADFYTGLGYDIFILDYRGYGKSDGEIENQEQFLNDVSFAYTALAAKYNPDQIVIIGYSIGTGAATYLASSKNPKALILQAPYYNFLEFCGTRAPYIPNFLKKFTFETNKYIVNVKAPIYIFHGDQDRLIPKENSVRLQKLLKPTDSLFILHDVGHGGINDNEDFQQKLATILNH
jgi:pimeloyl-ACP methyl ester carboxylesterase